MNDREAVLEVFTADLPENVRVMNAPAVTEEIVFGRDEGGECGDQIHDRFRKALDELVDESVLQTGEAAGEKVYGLTVDWQDRWRGHALTYLRNLLTLTNRQVDDARGTKRGQLEHRVALIGQLLDSIDTPE